MSIINYITALGHRLVLWAAARYATVGTVPQPLLVDLAYREIERKAKRIAEIEAVISELADTRVTLLAYSQAADDRLYARFKEARSKIIEQLLSEYNRLDDAMAEAAESLVAANYDYEVTVKEARETLGIEVHE